MRVPATAAAVGLGMWIGLAAAVQAADALQRIRENCRRATHPVLQPAVSLVARGEE